MNLVSENINEAIKHLTPRSEEEILGNTDVDKLSDNELVKIWMNLGGVIVCTPTDIKIFNELKRRNSTGFKQIRSSAWYAKHKHKLNESIKHLTPRSLEEIIGQMRDLDAYHKISYIRDMEWRYPDIFKDFKESDKLDDESNQLLFLMKIKRSLKDKSSDVDTLISEFAKKYGRKNLLDKAENIFSTSELSQLKLSLFKKTQTPDEKEREENFDTYAFIGYEEEVAVKGKNYYKKELGIENLIKIDKYNHASLSQITMMKIRANVQYGGSRGGGNVWCVYIPKEWLGNDSYMKRDIPKHVLKWIDEHKFKV